MSLNTSLDLLLLCLRCPELQSIAIEITHRAAAIDATPDRPRGLSHDETHDET